MSEKLIICATCHEKLWAIREIGNQVALIPYSPEVPFFHAHQSICPTCEHSFWFEDDVKGHARLHVLDEKSGRLAIV